MTERAGDAFRSGPVVALDGITCRARGIAFLDGISLTVEEGEWLSVFGPSGCGKSALLRVISGNLRPEVGTVAVLGEPPSRAAQRVCHIADEPTQPGRLGAHGALVWRLGRRGVPASHRAARAAEAMEVVGLAAARDVPERDLTVGQRVALGIAGAIAADPALLLVDNVMAALPEPDVQRICKYLDGRRAADGLTVVHATCSSAEAERADRVAVLSEGRLLALEPPVQLLRRHAADRIEIEADNPEEVQRTARGIFDVEIIEEPRSIRFSARDPVEVAASVFRHPAGGASVVHIRRGTLWDAYARLRAEQR